MARVLRGPSRECPESQDHSISYSSLASTENRVMVEWLLDMRKAPIPVRYHYHRCASAVDHCLRVCAATHVLIPTVLDGLSAEAVGAFADQLAVNQALWPHLKILGAVGTMTVMDTGREGDDESDRLTEFEADAVRAVQDALEQALLTAKAPLRGAGTLQRPWRSAAISLRPWLRAPLMQGHSSEFASAIKIF